MYQTQKQLYIDGNISPEANSLAKFVSNIIFVGSVYQQAEKENRKNNGADGSPKENQVSCFFSSQSHIHHKKHTDHLCSLFQATLVRGDPLVPGPGYSALL